ncbi:MAG: HEAT repeat domain-containing protein [Calditrichaeota bacterium]|nr:HEAT repeat domain-containing protein [Calditrichota bacterium]MCB9368017.1 HEAT repeat domain-containing protein [Calditrichota bacterium]
MKILFTYVTLVIVSVFASHAVAAEPGKLIEDALGRFGLTSSAFESDRIWAEDDTFLLDEIRFALRSPLNAREVAFQAAGYAPKTLDELTNFPKIAALLNVNLPDAVYADIDSQLSNSPKGNPLEPLQSALSLAEGYRKQAFDSLSPDQRQALLLSIPLWFEDEDTPADDSLKGSLYRAFGIEADTSQDVTSDSVLTLLARVNRNALAAAGYAFLRGVAEMAAHEPEFPVPTPKKGKGEPPVSGVEGEVLFYQDSPLGRIVVGGKGPNRFTEEFAVIIDLGGDDKYVARCASAVGGIRRSTSVVIDYGGDDFYAPAGWLSQSCAILGLSALVDLAGDDTYRAGAFSQSAAFCGVSLLWDASGDDLYTASWFTQAAAVCGVALFTDGQGRDLYDGAGYGQAFASTFGFAALNDLEGNDVYRSGGLVKHEPLRPEDYRSLSQGFATGARPRGGGGYAILHDFGGNDFYDAEIFAQGVGYWYSLGALIDEAGNDSYSATQYAQGSGIHLACGVLEDASGDDRYTARFGPSQGAAHDLAVGMLCDGSGDDYYTVSGGQGMAITNSAAIFVDMQGNDLYANTEPTASLGGTRPARSFGNLALFVDGEGKDIYPGSEAADSSVWFRDEYGYGVDIAFDSTRPRETLVEVVLVPEDTTRSLEDLFKDASEWEVTDNRTKVRRARLALKAIGKRAVDWVGENKLATNSGLERRAIVELFKEYPSDALPYLRTMFEGSNPDGRRTAASTVAEMKATEAASWLEAKLEDPSYENLRPTILRTFGEINAVGTIPTLRKYAASKSERERLAAVVSLGKMKSADGYPELFGALSDSLFTVRSAAVYALADQPPQVIAEMQNSAAGNRDPAFVEQILLTLPMLADKWKSDPATESSVKSIAPITKMYLEFPDPRVQGAALLAAAAAFDDKSFDKLRKRFGESDNPILLARWKQAEARRKK